MELLRLQILTKFCADVIGELSGLSYYLNASTERGILNLELNDLERSSWPAYPNPLKSFVSALTTCREFYYIIAEQVSLGAPNSAIDFVRACQVKGMVNMLNSNQDELGPDICPYILQYSNRHLHPLLLPHLGGYLRYHFSPDRLPSWIGDDDICLSSLDYQPAYNVQEISDLNDPSLSPRKYDSPSDLQVRAKTLSIYSTIGESGDRCSDIGVLTGIDVQGLNGPCTAQVDIAASLDDRWWTFIADYDGDYHPDKAFGWFLVNYKAERMYASTNPSEALVWKGKDIWNMNSWKRLHSVHEITSYYETPEASVEPEESCVIC